MVDDAYLNGYAKHLGPAKSVVYLSLCRHVDKDQYAFPSEELIAKEFNISVRTVASAIALLKKWNLISIKREKDKKGKWLRNTYYLLDKSEWKKPDDNESHKSPHATDAHGYPHANNDKNPHAKVHMQPLHTKVTHLEGNTYIKETQENLINKITYWAYYEAYGTPSVSENTFKAMVRAAINSFGEEAVRNLYADQENAIAFLTDIKYLGKQ